MHTHANSRSGIKPWPIPRHAAASRILGIREPPPPPPPHSPPRYVRIRFQKQSGRILHEGGTVTMLRTVQKRKILKVRGASKIKSKKVNKKRTITVRRVIIFLNITRHPLLIWLHFCLHQYKTLKPVATAMAAIVVLTPAKNLDKVFGGFIVVFPLFNNFLGHV